jgi:hypothetical protein
MPTRPLTFHDKAKFTPVFEAAADLDVPSFVHSKNPLARERMV